MTEPTNPHAALTEAVKVAGGQTAFARICGCTQGNIWQLLNKGSPLPAQYVLAVEAATGISRHDLRPDLYPRETAAAEGSESPGKSNDLTGAASIAVCGVCELPADHPVAEACTAVACGLRQREVA
jgi:DNA-binding transcriptional regulator YdaS (Cro superfamily)